MDRISDWVHSRVVGLLGWRAWALGPAGRPRSPSVSEFLAPGGLLTTELRP